MPVPAPEVVARVKTLAAASARPVLTDEDVTTVIQAHPLVDRDGVTADQGDWAPTWDLNAILAELYGIKAGRVAGDFTFSADDASYNKGDVLANCLKMEALYASRAAGSAPTGRLAAQYPGDVDRLIVNG
jgi:hypothetical protein